MIDNEMNNIAPSPKATPDIDADVTETPAANPAVADPATVLEKLGLPAGRDMADAEAKPAVGAADAAGDSRAGKDSDADRQKGESRQDGAGQSAQPDGSASGTAPAGASPRLTAIDIIYKSPKLLKPHAESGKVPKMTAARAAELADDMARRGYDPCFPVLIAPDGETLLDGRQRCEAAIKNNLDLVPCVIVDVEDQVEAMFRYAALRRHMTRSQQVALAAGYREHLSRKYKTERARAAVEAKRAKKAGNLSGAAPDKLKAAPAKDATKETVALWDVSERELRNYMELPEPKQAEVREGKTTIAKVRSELKKAAEAKAQRQRLKEAEKMPALDDYVDGDGVAVVEAVKRGTARLLVLDQPDLSEFERVVKEVGSRGIMLGQCHVFATAGFHDMEAKRKALTAGGFTVRDQIIWHISKSAAPGDTQGPVGQIVTILWATKGDVGLDAAGGHRISKVVQYPRDKDCADALPANLIRELLRVTTVVGELVVIPFDRMGNGCVSAKNMKRKVVAGDSGEWHLLGRLRIDALSEPVQKRRFDEEMAKAIGAEAAAIQPSVPFNVMAGSAPSTVPSTAQAAQ